MPESCLSTDVIAANAHDSEKTGDLARRAEEAANHKVGKVLGDTACGTSTARKAECSAGRLSTHYGRPKGTRDHRFTFSRKVCTDCPLRSKCTTSSVGARKVTVCEKCDDLRCLRLHQRTKAFKRAYRRRVKVKHRIARLGQLGVRQAKYFGRAKVAFQVCIAATVANMVLACSAAAMGARYGCRSIADAIHTLQILWPKILAGLEAQGSTTRKIRKRVGGLALAAVNTPSRPGL